MTAAASTRRIPTAALWLLAVLAGALLLALATIPLSPRDQAIFGGLTALAFVVGNRFAGRQASLILVVLSLAVSLRYVFWRLTETLHFDGWLAGALGVGLLLAECYAVASLALGYLQSAWPRHRKVRPLPPDPARWPSVDVFIPTFDEPLAVVRATLLAAMAIDWPPDRLRVWLLDDGRRPDFRRFAEQIGCSYLARPDNRHAKAGNLNHALAASTGDFIAVFDCDHIPTRAFLQLTMGWLVAEPNLALVQTPHHFYSPDPFQRNLAAGARVPAEGHLFHGLLQDGKDSFNAAFFCGSAAVLRRAALDEIGGVATQTVTEDAHTMLKLHRRGWGSAYLGLPMSAGLATERLARHLRQRMRWARGMLQILRIDNPLFGRGLTLAQRLCYLQASGHYLFALPRLAFLTAPLAFLLAGQNIIAASPLAITAYALPHIFHAIATNARLQRNWRHSFWSEIYETVLALFLVRVTLATLASPRRGRFDVTAKGGLLENGFFDLRAVYPNLILAALLLAGLLRGVLGLTVFDNTPLVTQALAMNAVWAAVSLLIVLAALAVGRETREVRSRAQMHAALPISLRLPDGTTIAATTQALSQEGGLIVPQDGAAVPQDCDVEAVFVLAAETVRIPAHVRRSDARGVALRWEPRTLEQESQVIQAVFGRADAWTGWADDPLDRPLASLARVVASVAGLFRPRVRPARAISAAGAVLVTALLAAPPPARAQSARLWAGPPPTSAVEHAASRTVQGARGELPDEPVPLPPPPPPPPPEQTPAEATPADAPPAPATPAAPDTATPADAPPQAPASAPADSIRHVVLNLRQLGAPGALALRGTNQTQAIQFGLRGDEVVTAAQLGLTGAMSPALLPDLSNVTVTLNDQYVGTIPASRDQPNFTLDLPISPVFFQDINRLGFRFAGRTAPDCQDPLSGLLWATIYDASTLSLTLQRLPPQRDLSRLPLPFFDPAVNQPLVLPVVLPPAPGNDALRAAAIMASWFGSQSGARGASFPLAAAMPAQGNAVLIVVTGDGTAVADLPGLPPIEGPTLAVLANPTDPYASVLIVGGRTGAEAVAAATALSAGGGIIAGAAATVRAPALAPRTAYDAPNWMPTGRAVRLGDLVGATELQSSGYTGSLHVPFRTAPDLYTWRGAPYPLQVGFRAPPGPVVDLAASRLDVGINGGYLVSVPLAEGSRDGWLSRLSDKVGLVSPRSQARIDIPAYAVAGRNDLQFYFDARPLHRSDCSAIPGDLRMAVDRDSTIDLSRGIRFAEMPNLGYFVGSGFPFTRMADLSETGVVLPDRPSAAEIGVFLDLMGRMGAATGLAATQVAVTRPEGASALGERDLLVIGTLDQLGPAERLLAGAPLRFDGRQVALALPTPLDAVRHVFGGSNRDAERERVASVISTGLPDGTALLVGGESPMAAGRSVVALLAGEPGGLTNALAALRVPEQEARVQGDLVLLSAEQVSSYRVGAGYTVGSLPFWVWPSWALRDQPFGLAAIALAACVLLGLALFWLLRRRDADHATPPVRRDGAP